MNRSNVDGPSSIVEANLEPTTDTATSGDLSGELVVAMAHLDAARSAYRAAGTTLHEAVADLHTRVHDVVARFQGESRDLQGVADVFIKSAADFGLFREIALVTPEFAEGVARRLLGNTEYVNAAGRVVLGELATAALPQRDVGKRRLTLAAGEAMDLVRDANAHAKFNVAGCDSSNETLWSG